MPTRAALWQPIIPWLSISSAGRLLRTNVRLKTLSGFHTGDTGRINEFGANFALDGVPVGSGFIPHDGVLTGVLADGAPLHVLATGRVYLLPEPAGWLLAAVAAVFVARASKGP